MATGAGPWPSAGRGRTSPNPLVGAVIVDDAGVVVGTGSTSAPGEAA
jgi:diaminohydroxyphosphoribosylaminopyrimidine deaminase/5-amino-6-(5-phosphoribosylamino)uracil reductase